MKIFKTTVLFFLFIFLLSCTSGEEEIAFYVSPEGNDMNPGTVEQPFKNIEKAQETVS